MKKNSLNYLVGLISLFMTTSLSFFVPRMLEAQTTHINYGFVTTLDALADTTKSKRQKIVYDIGYCPKFLEKLKNDHNFEGRSKYKFWAHEIFNQGQSAGNNQYDNKGVLIYGPYDGLKPATKNDGGLGPNKPRVDIICGGIIYNRNQDKKRYPNLIFSDNSIFDSEVRVLLKIKKLTLKEASDRKSLSSLGEIFKKKNISIGILSSHTEIYDVLIDNNFAKNNITTFLDEKKLYDSLQSLDDSAIAGIAGDIIYLDQFIKRNEQLRTQIEKKDFAIVPPRVYPKNQESHPISYKFVTDYDNPNGVHLVERFDSLLKRHEYASLSKDLEYIRENLDKLSPPKEKTSPQRQFWPSFLDTLSAIFRSSAFRIASIVLFVSILPIPIILPRKTKQKALDLKWEVMAELIAEVLGKFG